jgi:hypothetical protein
VHLAYQYGLGVAQSNGWAVVLYPESCAGGWTGACTLLGTMYRDGLGVARDEARAVEFYQQACDGGVTEACNQVRSLRP